MNFLFITTMLIMLFTLVSSSMGNSLKTTATIATKQKHKIERLCKLANDQVIKEYKSHYKKSDTKKETKSDTQNLANKRRDKTFKPRKNCKGSPSKLNLYALTSKSTSAQQQKVLSEALSNLLLELYKNAPFFNAKTRQSSVFLTNFTNEIIKQIKKGTPLSKISFSNSSNRELYIIMCNGSYDKNGISLLDYVTITESKDNRGICFKHLSLPVLKAYFGEKVSTEIIEAETKRFYDGKRDPKMIKKDVETLLSSLGLNTHKELLRYDALKSKNTQEYLTFEGTLLISGPPE